jgi:hypothetical protein
MCSTRDFGGTPFEENRQAIFSANWAAAVAAIAAMHGELVTPNMQAKV